MQNKQVNILILGAGFGGLSTANELREKLSPDEAKITIIDKKDWFMMDLVKLWIIKGTRKFESSKRSLKNITKKRIDFLKDEVISIDVKKKKVKTTNQELSFDYLIIALGVELASERIPGLLENGLVLYDINHVQLIHEKIIKLKTGKLVFAIMGMPYKCPPAPFEAALIINNMLKNAKVKDNVKVDFYSPAPITLPAAGSQVSQQLLSLLEAENIMFHGSHKTTSVRQNKLIFENSDVDFDLLLAVPPHKAPQVIYDSDLAKEGSFVSINRECKTYYDKVYAIGDVTNMMVNEKMAIPKAGIFAEEQGITVAKNIISQIKKEHENAIFDGKGGCFVELGSDKAGYVEVDMFAKPNPITLLKEPARKHMQEKEKFESERLEKWL